MYNYFQLDDSSFVEKGSIEKLGIRKVILKLKLIFIIYSFIESLIFIYLIRF